MLSLWGLVRRHALPLSDCRCGRYPGTTVWPSGGLLGLGFGVLGISCAHALRCQSTSVSAAWPGECRKGTGLVFETRYWKADFHIPFRPSSLAFKPVAVTPTPCIDQLSLANALTGSFESSRTHVHSNATPLPASPARAAFRPPVNASKNNAKMHSNPSSWRNVAVVNVRPTLPFRRVVVVPEILVVNRGHVRGPVPQLLPVTVTRPSRTMRSTARQRTSTFPLERRRGDRRRLGRR